MQHGLEAGAETVVMSGEFRAKLPGWTVSLALCVVFAVAAGGCATVKNATKKLFRSSQTALAGSDSSEAPRVEIDISGVDVEIADNVRSHLSLGSEPCDAPEWRVMRLTEKGQQEALTGLRAMGYYEPEIDVELGRDESCWRATIDVEPGPRVVIKTVDTRLEGPGSDDEEFLALLTALPARVGEPLNHKRYENSKQAIANHAIAHGYLDGRFVTTRLGVEIANAAAHIELVYDTGKRYRLGDVTLAQTDLEPELVERLARAPTGEPYDAAEIVDINRRLSHSGYFDSVDLRPRLQDPVDDSIPVDVTLTPRKRHAFTVGGGLTTDAGPRAKFGYENRRLNRRGHRLSVQTSFSLVEQSFDTEYRIPLGDPRTEWLIVQAGARREDTTTSQSNSFKLGASQTQQRWGDWLETRFVSFSRETFDVGRESGSATLLIPGLSVRRTVSNDRLRPTAGHRVFVEVRGAHDGFGSDTSFGRAFISAGWIRGLPWGGRLHARTDLGAMVVDDFDALPPSQRFFAGGDTTIRGYEFQSLGPKNEFGDVIGGRYLVVGSLEYEHPIVPNWSVAAFVDGGNAFDAGAENEEFKFGVGAGLRWQSPIGPVRLDLAHPMDNNEVLRIHLRLGPDL